MFILADEVWVQAAEFDAGVVGRKLPPQWSQSVNSRWTDHYAVVGFFELLIVLAVMLYVFGVPIHGNIPLLLALSMLFITCSLGLGLLVSTLARTQLEAIQFAFVIMLPSVLLSGFVFPRSEMPFVIYAVTFLIPATYFIEILRGVILRAADFFDLIEPVIGLSICCIVVLTLSIMRFRKQLS